MLDNVIKIGMSQNESFRWQKALWSIVILTAIVCWVVYTTQQHYSKLGAFPFFAIAWIVFTIGSAIILLLRLFRFCRRDAFLYIFLSLANLLLALSGFYFGIGDWPKTWILVIPYLVSGSLAAFMLVDVFATQTPSSRTVNEER
jgi:hypothetical protein